MVEVGISRLDNLSDMSWWFSGRILACHAGDPSSILGYDTEIFFSFFFFCEDVEPLHKDNRYFTLSVFRQQSYFFFPKRESRTALALIVRPLISCRRQKKELSMYILSLCPTHTLLHF